MKCFGSSRNCHFRLLLSWFLARTPQKQPAFLASDGEEDDASDMLKFSEVFRNGLNWVKKMIFWFILHPMRHIPKFCQIQDLIKIYIWSKFYQYSIWGCEMKDFKGFLNWFSIHEMFPFFAIFCALTPPNIVRCCWNFDHR